MDVVTSSPEDLVLSVLQESFLLVELVICVLLDPSLQLVHVRVLHVESDKKLTVPEPLVPSVHRTSITQSLAEPVCLAQEVNSPLERVHHSVRNVTVERPSSVAAVLIVLLELTQ